MPLSREWLDSESEKEVAVCNYPFSSGTSWSKLSVDLGEFDLTS